MDGGWLVSIWQYINKIGFQMYVKYSYVPQLPRQHDPALIDYFVMKCIPKKVLKIFNRCRVYLQVIFISDTVDAAGTIVPWSMVGWLAQERVTWTGQPSRGHPPQLGVNGGQL